MIIICWTKESVGSLYDCIFGFQKISDFLKREYHDRHMKHVSGHGSVPTSQITKVDLSDLYSSEFPSYCIGKSWWWTRWRRTSKQMRTKASLVTPEDTLPLRPLHALCCWYGSVHHAPSYGQLSGVWSLCRDAVNIYLQCHFVRLIHAELCTCSIVQAHSILCSSKALRVSHFERDNGPGTPDSGTGGCHRPGALLVQEGVSYRLAGMLSATPPSHPTLLENQKTQNE